MIQVKVIDEEHEDDLANKINEFLKELEEFQLVDIKYAINAFLAASEQIYCYSALIIYRDSKRGKK